jgi:serine-type D-Ala-D-Ala carboxypeptidase/endopeptidase
VCRVDSVERLLRAESGRGVRTRVAAVSRGGVRTFAGVSPIGAALPDDRTLFEIGSVTKAFTGTLLADMHLRGEVGLSEPLTRLLPPSQTPSWRFRPPTLEELATHRSHLPNVPRQLAGDELLAMFGLSRGDPWAGVSEDDFRGMVSGMRPGRAPGGRMRYSSLGVGLLGDALAARAGMPWERLVRERVCEPLGLADTAVAVAPEASSRLLQGHTGRGAPRPPLEDWMPAAGSLRSSAADVLTFLEAAAAAPEGPLGPAFELALRPRARIGRHVSIGLCWMILSRPGKAPVAWHNGGTWGFRSFAAVVPDDAFAVVALSNTKRSVDRLGFKLLEEAL